MPHARTADLRTAVTAWPIRFLGVLVVSAGGFAMRSTAHAADRSDNAVACVASWGEARYRNAGYDHIVHIQNRCEKTVLCRVTTNVNPDPVEGTVAPREEREVLTFRGSPAREFVPKVDCRLLK
jgi:hypothetical protein